MAAAAATVTAVPPAASSCGKRDGDNACVVDMPRKAKKGRSPPEEEVEAFLAAAESSVARRFAAKTMQVGSEEVKRNDDEVNSEELNASHDEVGVDIGGYAQDPNDDSDLQEIMQDPDGFEKSVKKLLDILQPDYPECLKRRKFI